MVRSDEGEQEPGFRVTDRRRVRSEESGEPASTPRESAEEQSAPAGSPQADAPPINIPVPDLVRMFILELQTRALVHMGLIPRPATQLVVKDLPQACLAIDCLAALVKELTPSVPSAERSALEGMLAQLRLHFVEQSRG